MPERRDPGLLEGDRTAGGPGPQWLRCGHFPPAASIHKKVHGLRHRLCIAKQNSRNLCHPPLALRPSAAASGAGPCRPPSEVIATKAAMGAANPSKDRFHD